MAETQTVIKVESALWLEFKAQCVRHEISPTRMITALIEEQILRWDEEKWQRINKIAR